MKITWKLIVVLALGAPSGVYAHGLGEWNGLMSGMLHPLTGVDHLLALAGIALLGIRLGGKHSWALPLAFLSMMVLGGIAAMQGLAVGLAEVLIAISLLTVGVLLLGKRVKQGVFLSSFLGVFALAHGAAHGAEMPVNALPLAYMAGFVISCAMIQLVAVVLGRMVQRTDLSTRGFQAFGLMLAGAGLHLLSF